MMLLIVVPFTAVYCALPLVLFVCIVELIVFLLMPLMLFYAVSGSTDCNCKPFAYVLLIIFYPTIGGLFAFIGLIVLLIYPFARNRYHHGVYDPLDMLVLHMTAFYLKAVSLLVMCCCT